MKKFHTARLERIVLNVLWGGMVLVGILYAAFTGNMAEVTAAAIGSSKEAVSLCITMLGVVAMWSGLMEVASGSGLVARLTAGLEGVLDFLFPRIPAGHQARGYIALNMIANMLGLGWAATPAGLKAMEELAKLEDERGAAIKHVPMKNCNHKTEDKVEDKMEDRTEDKAEDQKVHRKSETGIASDEMCTFLIINISSLQLIPVNIIAYRSQYVSVNPTAIIVPGLIATVFSTVAAVIFCKIMCGKE